MLRVGRQLSSSTFRLTRERVLPLLGCRDAASPSAGSLPLSLYSSVSQCSKSHGGKTRRCWDGRSVCRDAEAAYATLPASARVITSIALNHDAGMLQVRWEGDEVEAFPYVWLRDNCSCPSCYHASSHSRLTLMSDIDLEAKPSSAEVVRGGQQVKVVWRDGHYSTYTAEWLYRRGFSEARRRARSSCFRLERKYWGSEVMENLPKASFQSLIVDDAALLEWLRQLEVFGFVKVSGALTEPGQVRRLAERIGFIKKTHYGEDFTVTVKPDPSNPAYNNGPLDLHVDLPYYEYQPGTQFIHCIVQYNGVGGDSQFTDAVHVAHQLQRTCPGHYRVLTDTPVDWHDIGTDETGEFYKVVRLPVICVDESGEIRRINLSQHQRDSYFSVPSGEVAAWYAALTAYHRLLTDPKYCLQFKMTPGTIVTFDNSRILHGRTGYPSGQGDRHLEGCYVDWDEVRSRRRILEKQLDPHQSDDSQ